MLKRQLLHRRSRQLIPPPFGFIRLGIYCHYLMAILNHSLQRRYRKFRRTHKNNPHDSASFQVLP